MYQVRKVSVEHREHPETQDSEVIPDWLDSRVNEVTVVIQVTRVPQVPPDDLDALDLSDLLVHQALRVLEVALDSLVSKVLGDPTVNKVSLEELGSLVLPEWPEFVVFVVSLVTPDQLVNQVNQVYRVSLETPVPLVPLVNRALEAMLEHKVYQA